MNTHIPQFLFHLIWDQGLRECKDFFFEDPSFEDSGFKKLPEASPDKSSSSHLKRIKFEDLNFGSTHR
jgi:hypothetical protein